MVALVLVNFFSLDSGKVLRNEGIWVIKISIVIIPIVMSNLIHSIKNDLRNPLFSDFFYPFIVIIVDCHFKVRYLVCYIFLFPFTNIFYLNLPFFLTLIAYIL